MVQTDARMPIDKERVIEEFMRLPYQAQIGLLSSMAVMTTSTGKPNE